MFPEGQQVEVVAGGLAGMTGVVVTREGALQRELQPPDNPLLAENELLVVVTLSGRDIVVVVTTDDVQAI